MCYCICGWQSMIGWVSNGPHIRHFYPWSTLVPASFCLLCLFPVLRKTKKTMIGPNIITSIPSWKNSLVRHLTKARVSQKLHRNRWNLVIGPQGGCAKGPRVYHIACRAVNEIGRSIQSWHAWRPCNKCETISSENDHHPGILKDFPLVWCLSHVLFCWIMIMKWLMINAHFILSHSVFLGV